MSRPRFTLRTLLLAVTVCSLGALAYRLLPNDVTEAQIHQLRRGMTKAEVIAILGEPDSVDREGVHSGWWNYDESWNYGKLWSVRFEKERFTGAGQRF